MSEKYKNVVELRRLSDSLMTEEKRYDIMTAMARDEGKVSRTFRRMAEEVDERRLELSIELHRRAEEFLEMYGESVRLDGDPVVLFPLTGVMGSQFMMMDRQLLIDMVASKVHVDRTGAIDRQ